MLFDVHDIPEDVIATCRSIMDPSLYRNLIKAIALKVSPHAPDVGAVSINVNTRFVAFINHNADPVDVARDVVAFQGTDEFCRLADQKFPVLFKGVIDYPQWNASREVDVRRVNEDGTLWVTRTDPYGGTPYTCRSLFPSRCRPITEPCDRYVS